MSPREADHRVSSAKAAGKSALLLSAGGGLLLTKRHQKRALYYSGAVNSSSGRASWRAFFCLCLWTPEALLFHYICWKASWESLFNVSPTERHSTANAGAITHRHLQLSPPVMLKYQRSEIAATAMLTCYQVADIPEQFGGGKRVLTCDLLIKRWQRTRLFTRLTIFKLHICQRSHTTNLSELISSELK